jgi:hypothetical protein
LVNFVFPIGAIVGSEVYSTSSQGQGQVTTDFATAMTPLIDKFPAQDIQVSVDVAALIVSAYTVKMTIGVILAPRVHVRPDWLNRDAEAKFLGAETGGS